ADLRRNRHDRLPARRVLTLVVENQPHRALAHFRGKLVRRLAHDAPSYSGVGASGKPGAVHFANGSLATVSWYFMDRACFSDTSACKRSPTILGGSCCRLMATPIISS